MSGSRKRPQTRPVKPSPAPQDRLPEHREDAREAFDALLNKVAKPKRPENQD